MKTAHQPTTNNQQPTTNNQQPTTNSEQRTANSELNQKTKHKASQQRHRSVATILQMKRKSKGDLDENQAENFQREGTIHDDGDALLEAFMDSIEDTEEKPDTLTHEKESIISSQNEKVSEDTANGVDMELDMNEVEQASYEARIGKLIILSRGKNKEDDFLNDKIAEDATNCGSRLVMEDKNELEKEDSNSISLTELLRKKKKQRKQHEADFNDDVNWL